MGGACEFFVRNVEIKQCRGPPCPRGNVTGKAAAHDDEGSGVGGGRTAPGGDNDGADEEEDGKGGNGIDLGQDAKNYFTLPMSVTNWRFFKGIAKSKRSGEVDVTVKLPSK